MSSFQPPLQPLPSLAGVMHEIMQGDTTRLSPPPRPAAPDNVGAPAAARPRLRRVQASRQFAPSPAASSPPLPAPAPCWGMPPATREALAVPARRSNRAAPVAMVLDKPPGANGALLWGRDTPVRCAEDRTPSTRPKWLLLPLSELDENDVGDAKAPSSDEASRQCLRALQLCGITLSPAQQRATLGQLCRLDSVAQAALLQLFEQILSPHTVDVQRMACSLQNKSRRQLVDLTDILLAVGRGAMVAATLPDIADKWMCLSPKERSTFKPWLVTAIDRHDNDHNALALVDQGLSHALQLPPAQRTQMWRALYYFPTGRDPLPMSPIIGAWQSSYRHERQWRDLIRLIDKICPSHWTNAAFSELVAWGSQASLAQYERLLACAPDVWLAIEQSALRPIDDSYSQQWRGVLEAIKLMSPHTAAAAAERVAKALDSPSCRGALGRCLRRAAAALQGHTP